MSTEEEIVQLIKHIKENGNVQSDGRTGITFGKLYDQTVDIFEALNGTLRAAKKAKAIDFEGQMLLKGPNDKVIIYLIES